MSNEKKKKRNAAAVPSVRPQEQQVTPAQPAKAEMLVMAGLIGLCMAVFLQTLGFDFVNIDDNLYIYENPFVAGGLSLSAIKWAATSFHATNWHPLTWLSHLTDVSLFGMRPAGHHFANVLLHSLNSVLVFIVVRGLTGAFWKSAAVAAIFAIHPAHVESVAWVAERKDVLSTLFWLLTTWAYIRWVKDGREDRYYWLAIGFFALGLMSKPMLVTLPFTLILLDYWPLERFERWNVATLMPVIKEKIPFFALASVSAVLTIFAQGSGGAIQTLETIPPGDRVVNSVVSYVKYIGMLVYPVDLAVWYPFDKEIPLGSAALASVVLAGITALAIWQIRTRKFVFVGWMWFLGTLVPVIGLIQVGRQAMSDRYTYVPYIGLTIAIIWLLGEVVERIKLNRSAVAAAAGISVVILGYLAFFQTSHWRNSETLYRHALQVTEGNYFVENNYCDYLAEKNRLPEAAEQCEAAIRHEPELAEAYNTLGTVQLKQNDLDKAAASFQRSGEIAPGYTLPHANLAMLEVRRNNIDAAVEHLKTAVRTDTGGFFDPERLFELYAEMGLAAMTHKRYDKAIEMLQEARRIRPGSVDIERNLALSLHLTGKSGEAIEILENSLMANPNSAETFNSLGLILAEQNRMGEAAVQFRNALRINPNFEPARNNLMRATGGG